MPQNSIWRFSRMVYEQGAFDGMLASLGSMLKPGVSLLDILTAMEDWASDADLDAIDRVYERIEPMIGAMAEEKAAAAIKTLLDTSLPLIDKGGGLYHLMQTAQGVIPLIKANLDALMTILRTALPHLPAVLLRDARLGARAGSLLARQINAAGAAINRAYDADPQGVRAFFEAFTSTIDPRAFRKTADIITGCVLDQRPPIITWTLATAAGRLKKRFLG